MFRFPPLAIGLVAVLDASLATPAASQWQAGGVPVCTAPGDQERVTVLADAAGGAFLAWEDRRGGEADIYLTRLSSSGIPVPGWPLDGLAVCAVPLDQLAPALAPDGAGGVFVAWYDGRSTGHVAVQRITAGGAPAAGWPVDGWLMGPASFRVFAIEAPRPPALGADGSGGALLAWEGVRDFFFHTFLQRLGPDGNPPAGWPAGGLAVAAVENDQIEPCMAVSGPGALLAWSDYRSGQFDLYVQAVTMQGSVASDWPPTGLAVCGADSDQVAPEIIPDGAGGAIVAWSDMRHPPHSDLYAVRLTSFASLAPGWPAGGLAVCTAWGHQRWPRLLPDGNQGAFLVWQDERFDLDVYVARVRGTGWMDPAWPLQGLAVCAEPNPQRVPVLAGDGAGGMMVAWQDERPGGAVHAQRVTGDGTPLWRAGGIPLSQSGASADRAPAIAAGVGGAFIAWADDRNGLFDIFAQRVGPQGPPVSVSDPSFPAAEGLRLEPPRPSPAREQVSIRFALPRAGLAEVMILDAAGRRVRTLGRSVLSAGSHGVTWDGRDERGLRAGAGLYWVRLSWSHERRARRLVWLSRP